MNDRKRQQRRAADMMIRSKSRGRYGLIDLSEMLSHLTEALAPVATALADFAHRMSHAVSAFHGEITPVRYARWEWYEEWSPSTTDHYAELEDCGWKCGACNIALADMVGGHWDNPVEEPKVNYCPNCGARMDGDSQ